MKKGFILLIILLCSVIDCNSQWIPLNSGTRLRLNNIFFINELNGYVVGGGDSYEIGKTDGIIIKTTDGGLHWRTVYRDSMLAVTEVVAYDSLVFCFGNRNGTPIQIISNDYGNSWKIMQGLFDINSPLVSNVRILNKEIFFLSSGNLVRISNNQSKIILSNVACFNIYENEIMALTSNAKLLKKSQNFGSTWIQINVNSDRITGNSMTDASIFFSKDSIAIRGTYPHVIVYSIDNGINWKYTDKIVYHAYFINPNLLFGTDLKGLVYKTNDWGANWTVDGTAIWNVTNFFFLNEDSGFLCGANGLIMKRVENK